MGRERDAEREAATSGAAKGSAADQGGHGAVLGQAKRHSTGRARACWGSGRYKREDCRRVSIMFGTTTKPGLTISSLSCLAGSDRLRSRAMALPGDTPEQLAGIISKLLTDLVARNDQVRSLYSTRRNSLALHPDSMAPPTML